MAFTLKTVYGAATTMTCSLHKDDTGASNGLPSNAAAGREATKIVNSSDLAVDVLVQLKTKLQAGTIGSNMAVFIYAYGCFDDSASYPDTLTGVDGYVVLNSPTQLVLVGQILTGTANQAYISNVFSVAAAFGGCLPDRWGILIVNSSGCRLTSTAGDHVLKYKEVNYEMV